MQCVGEKAYMFSAIVSGAKLLATGVTVLTVDRMGRRCRVNHSAMCTVVAI
jgi:hypothetical protein